MVTSVFKAVHDFFHARTGVEGCRVAGWMRIGFALLFFIDRLVLSLDLELLMSPTKGMLPFRAGSERLAHFPLQYCYSIFQLAPDSDTLLWAMYYVGQVQAILLLLGISPRFQLFCLYMNIKSFYNHNQLVWDAEDCMFRLWAFLMLFFPLHHVTIYDLVSKKNLNVKADKSKIVDRSKTDSTDASSKNLVETSIEGSTHEDSWPMWPFRLFQIYLCFVYIGASVSKYAGEVWRNGLALYYISYESDFYGNVFNPDLLFNRLLPLKIACWSSLALELSCWIMIWPSVTRIPTLIAMVLLHLGIELSMNMNVFEYITLLGWVPFLVYPAPAGKFKLPSITRRVLETVLCFFLLFTFAMDTMPMNTIAELAPEALQQPLYRIAVLQNDMFDEYVQPFIMIAGYDAYVWSMFGGFPDNSNCYYDVTMHKKDESEVKWRSPDWRQMKWYQKKRYMRMMNYYENMEGHGVNEMPAQRALCQYLARNYAGGLDQVNHMDVILRCEVGPEPPKDLGWFEPARREMETSSYPLYYYDPRRPERPASDISEVLFVKGWRDLWWKQEGVLEGDGEDEENEEDDEESEEDDEEEGEEEEENGEEEEEEEEGEEEDGEGKEEEGQSVQAYAEEEFAQLDPSVVPIPSSELNTHEEL